MHMSGVKNVVAICGTSFSKKQGELLANYVEEVVSVFDGDDAGSKAAEQLLKTVKDYYPSSLRVREVKLKKGQDPYDLAKKEGSNLSTWLLNEETSI